MAIRSDNFAGVFLSEEDARAFERQIEDNTPNERGLKALERGLELLQGTVPVAEDKGARHR
jgi:hypothetical protein